MNKVIIVLVLVMVWSGCAKNNVTDVSTTDCSTISGATFSNNNGEIYTIISSKCGGSTCHSAGGSESGKFLVTTNYNTIKPLLATATRSVLDGTMPETGSLSTAELQKWQCWSNNGFPQ